MKKTSIPGRFAAVTVLVALLIYLAVLIIATVQAFACEPAERKCLWPA